MANKSHTTRSNVLVKRGDLPAQRLKKIVDEKSLEGLKRKAEKAGLILHVKKKGGKQ